jgi:glycine cleavage system H protein
VKTQILKERHEMKIDKWDFPEELYYTKEHVWARLEDDIITIGLSSFGQDLAGDIIFVETPRVGRIVDKLEPFMSMESGKWVGRVKAPVAGTIEAINEELEWEGAAVNEDPYDTGWLAKFKDFDVSQLDDLLKTDMPAFAEHIAAERTKYNK